MPCPRLELRRPSTNPSLPSKEPPEGSHRPQSPPEILTILPLNPNWELICPTFPSFEQNSFCKTAFDKEMRYSASGSLLGRLCQLALPLGVVVDAWRKGGTCWQRMCLCCKTWNKRRVKQSKEWKNEREWKNSIETIENVCFSCLFMFSFADVITSWAILRAKVVALLVQRGGILGIPTGADMKRETEAGMVFVSKLCKCHS